MDERLASKERCFLSLGCVFVSIYICMFFILIFTYLYMYIYVYQFLSFPESGVVGEVERLAPKERRFPSQGCSFFSGG